MSSSPSRRRLVAGAAQRLTRFLQPGEVVADTADGRLSLRLRREDRAARPVRLQQMAYHAIEALDSLSHSDDSDDSANDLAGVIDLGVGWAPITRKQGPVDAERFASDAAAESLWQRDLQPRQLSAHLLDPQPRVSWWSSGNQVLAATVGGILVPFIVLAAFWFVGLDISSVVYWVLVGSLS